MKRTIVLLITSVSILACNKTQKENQGNEISKTQTVQPTNDAESENKFDIEHIPYSIADLGSFPFLTLPKGLKEMNKPLKKGFDVCFFPINGKMTAFEGQLYKANISAEQGQEFSQHYFEKSMEDLLKSIGAVKVFEGEITQKAYDSYNKQDPNKGEEGDMGYPGEAIKFYVIRSKEKGDIYVQYTANNAAGKLNVLQSKNAHN
jgi:OmpA-OmpF porin, OOP family